MAGVSGPEQNISVPVSAMALNTPVTPIASSPFAGRDSNASPALPAEQAERLAVIVPQMMRIPLALSGERALRKGVLEELRQMLVGHLRHGQTSKV